MKRIHRRWHRLIWALLLPGLVVLLLLTEPVPGDPPADAVLPPALASSPLEGGH
jgi:hypothetical protein